MRWLMGVLLSWVVPAASAVAQGGCVPPQQAALAALNALRSRPQRCGAQLRPAVPALRWQAQLGEAARRYAAELALRDRVEHVGVAGDSLQTRLLAAGYPLKGACENLAGGLEELDEVLAQWMASPEHCDNLMAAEFEDVGLACARGPGEYRFYWVLDLGVTPLRSSPGRSP